MKICLNTNKIQKCYLLTAAFCSKIRISLLTCAGCHISPQDGATCTTHQTQQTHQKISTAFAIFLCNDLPLIMPCEFFASSPHFSFISFHSSLSTLTQNGLSIVSRNQLTVAVTAAVHLAVVILFVKPLLQIKKKISTN